MATTEKNDGNPTPQETVELQRTIAGHTKLRVLKDKLVIEYPESFRKMSLRAKDSRGHFVSLFCKVFKTEQGREHCIVLGFTQTGTFFTGPCKHAIDTNVPHFEMPEKYFFSELVIAKFIADNEDHNDSGESRILIVQALKEVNVAMEKIITQLENDPESFFKPASVAKVESAV